jgi:hypothetical protein
MISHNLMAIGINAEAAWRHFDAPINEREHGEETAKRLPVNAIVSATSAKPERGQASRERLSVFAAAGVCDSRALGPRRFGALVTAPVLFRSKTTQFARCSPRYTRPE